MIVILELQKSFNCDIPTPSNVFTSKDGMFSNSVYFPSFPKLEQQLQVRLPSQALEYIHYSGGELILSMRVKLITHP